MFLRSVVFAAAALASGLTALPAQALEPLNQEAYINDRLVSARVADRIRRECPSISANMLKAFGEAQALKAYAQRKGYPDAQIDAFLDDRKERQRIYALAEDYMRKRGVKDGNADSFCALGYAEINARSVTGSLIRKK